MRQVLEDGFLKQIYHDLTDRAEKEAGENGSFLSRPVVSAGLDDIDWKYAAEVFAKTEAASSCYGSILQDRRFIHHYQGKGIPTGLALLLFGKNPRDYFPAACIRFLRFEGTRILTGRETNIINHMFFEGPVLKVTKQAADFMETQIREYTWLWDDGRFRTIPEYPPQAWQKVLNYALLHCDYANSHTGIIILLFTDHLEVKFPVCQTEGTVMKETERRFDAEHIDLEWLTYCGEPWTPPFEFNGVYEQMEKASLPEPEFYLENGVVTIRLRNGGDLNTLKKRLMGVQKGRNQTGWQMKHL